MKALHDYIPERIHLQDKRKSSSRICYEDCALLDANTLCVLASRGTTYPIGAFFPDCVELPQEDLCFLRSEVHHHSRILLGGRRPTLLFTELLGSVGVLIAISPELSAEGLFRAATHTDCGEPVFSPSFAAYHRVPLQNGDDELCLLLSEWFYYTDRIFSRRAVRDASARTQLLANFAGCRLIDQVLPITTLPISYREEMRLTAFLFCCFLSLRRLLGGVHMETDLRAGSDPLNFRLVLSLQRVTEVTQAKDNLPNNGVRKGDRKRATRKSRAHSNGEDPFAFLSLPAFRDFEIKQSETETLLEAALEWSAEEQAYVRAVGNERLLLCLTLQSA